ncbi:MAG: type II toxin-antitoxin system Phd/YefM family antitoxin [Nocardioides sp.]
MVSVGIRALKQNASGVVAEAAAGEVITITDRGRPVAQIGPIPASPVVALESAGRVRRARLNLADLSAPEPGASLTDELAGMREAERY